MESLKQVRGVKLRRSAPVARSFAGALRKFQCRLVPSEPFYSRAMTSKKKGVLCASTVVRKTPNNDLTTQPTQQPSPQFSSNILELNVQMRCVPPKCAQRNSESRFITNGIFQKRDPQHVIFQIWCASCKGAVSAGKSKPFEIGRRALCDVT